MSPVEELLRALDRSWSWPGPSPLRLEIIGSTALMLQASYHRGTKDSDVLETAQLDLDVKRRLIELGGPGSALHKKHRLYIDVVSNGIPFLPQRPRWHPLIELSAGLRHFEVTVLDVVDVVVSKLAPFRAQDRADIAAMVDRGLVSHDALAARFCDAVDYLTCDARAEELPRYIGNFHQVERDLFDAPETEVALPAWI